jgi:hypothetical protein
MTEIELPNPKELEELKREGFTKRVALVTAIFAVILAITSLGGNNAMKSMLLAQQQSSDQWAFYQSKVLREHLYRTTKAQNEAALLERGRAMSAEARVRYETLAAMYGEEEARFRSEKTAIENEAKRLESERDVSSSRDPYFDYAEVLLQIAIVMSSISILAGSSMIFRFAIVSAVLGGIFSLNGYLLLFRIPFFH